MVYSASLRIIDTPRAGSTPSDGTYLCTMSKPSSPPRVGYFKQIDLVDFQASVPTQELASALANTLAMATRLA